jgi:transcriptional regulator GlxA family with amidase domain
MAEKRQIAIVLYPGMTALDALGPYEVLKLLPNSEQRLVAHEPGPVVTDRSALIIGATHSVEETPHPFLVLVPGSEANTISAMADGGLLGWLKKAHDTSTMTTSVCSGALILAAAGLLEGQRATTHCWAQASLGRFGPTAMTDHRVVRSGKIWTAAGVSVGRSGFITVCRNCRSGSRLDCAIDDRVPSSCSIQLSSSKHGDRGGSRKGCS